VRAGYGNKGMSSNQISVVLLSCKRDENVRILSERYSSMEIVSDLIIWSSPPGDFRMTHPKVRCATCSPDWGMVPRYMVSTMAKSMAVMAVDDDLFVPEETISILLGRLNDDERIVHGLHGRGPNAGGNYSAGAKGEWSGGSDADVEIVCGRVAMFSRGLAHDAVSNFMLPEMAPMYDEADRLGVYPSQIEDMLLSYSAMARSGRLNRVYKLTHEELPCHDAICSKPNHYTYRNFGMKFLRNHFGIDQILSK
jgi:hypothetical protein